MKDNLKILPDIALAKGPDLLRGKPNTLAFIYTKYSSDDGRHFFQESGVVGHETMTDDPQILRALFGPELEEVLSKVTHERDEYVQDGIEYKTTGKKIKYLDYGLVRQLSMNTNLYGRFGKYNNQQLCMLWLRPEGWEQMLTTVLKELRAGPDCLVTSGRQSQFWAKDFLSEQGNKLQNSDLDDIEAIQDMAQQHIATGLNRFARTNARMGRKSLGAGDYNYASRKQAREELEKNKERLSQAEMDRLWDKAYENTLPSLGFKRWLAMREGHEPS